MTIEQITTILTGCKDGKPKYKEILYKSFYGYIKAVIIRYVNDYHATEELVNDSFIKIFNHINSFETPTNTPIENTFKAWIAKIASRTAIDHLRKKKIDFNDIDDTSVSNGLQASGSTIQDRSAFKEIMALLNQIPEKQKTVFNLFEIEGFSHEEIARILSIPENVSRVYLSRAKTKLKDLYIKHI